MGAPSSLTPNAAEAHTQTGSGRRRLESSDPKSPPPPSLPPPSLPPSSLSLSSLSIYISRSLAHSILTLSLSLSHQLFLVPSISDTLSRALFLKHSISITPFNFKMVGQGGGGGGSQVRLKISYLYNSYKILLKIQQPSLTRILSGP